METVARVLCSSEAVPVAAVGTATRARGVGLLGCGTVGAGVARRLLASHPGLVRGIAVRHPDKPRDVAWNEYADDPFALVDDPAIGVIVECIGGLGLARELVLRAIARGKDVVTANKDLIATEGPWLAAFAARTGASLRYEAAVGGAIPIVRALTGALADEDVLEVGGVLNGTTNFVLDAMSAGARVCRGAGRGSAAGLRRGRPARGRRRPRCGPQAGDPGRAGLPAARDLTRHRAARDRRDLGRRRAGRGGTRAAAQAGRGRAPDRGRDRGRRDPGLRAGRPPLRPAARGREHRSRAGPGLRDADLRGRRGRRRRDRLGDRGRRPGRAGRPGAGRAGPPGRRAWWPGRCGHRR